MLAYCVIYKKEINQGPPAGIIVLDNIDRNALVWNHRSKMWQYDPVGAVRFLDDPDKPGPLRHGGAGGGRARDAGGDGGP